MRLTYGGFSHGEQYTAIIEGMPCGVEISEQKINAALTTRRNGYGRGARMGIERDKIRFISGVAAGRSVGGPLVFAIDNSDSSGKRCIEVYRPGHADYAGAVKYDCRDAGIINERASARETVVRVATGEILRGFLAMLGISSFCCVEAVGGEEITTFDETLIAASQLLCPDGAAEERMRAAIVSAEKNGDTLGGRGAVYMRGVPVGIGDMYYERRLDARLGGAVLSVPSVKGVEFGLGRGYENKRGRDCADEFTEHGRASNNAGGVEGGMSNGEEIVIRFSVKPIPSIAGLTGKNRDGKCAPTKGIRSDVCAVPAVSMAAEAMVIYEMSRAIIEEFGEDLSAIKAGMDMRRARQ